MEVCGGHTHTIYRHGIEHVLPSNVELVHGPGCPVCVIPMGRVDDAIAVAETPGRDLHVVRRHDARARRQRQPARGQGARRRRALRLLAARRPAHRRSRTPTARSCSSPSASRPPRRRPRSRCSRPASYGVTNFTRLLQPRHDRPADQGDPRVARPAPRRLPRPRPRVDGGRQPALPVRARAVRQAAGHRRLRAARHPAGHRHAAARRSARAAARSRTSTPGSCATRATRGRWPVLAEVFELRPHFEWRGLGFISQSALEAAARVRRRSTPSCAIDVPGVRVADPKACQCGEVLKGVIKPWECKVFGTACTPGDADRHVHGVVRGRVRRVLQLRPAAPRGRGHAGPRRLRPAPGRARDRAVAGGHASRRAIRNATVATAGASTRT